MNMKYISQRKDGTYQISINIDGKRKTNLKKVFPGYVLVKMIVTEESWYIVRNTPGFTGFVGSNTKPVPLTEEEANRILKAKKPLCKRFFN